MCTWGGSPNPNARGQHGMKKGSQSVMQMATFPK
jgi:hypothetical protein